MLLHQRALKQVCIQIVHVAPFWHQIDVLGSDWFSSTIDIIFRFFTASENMRASEKQRFLTPLKYNAFWQHFDITLSSGPLHHFELRASGPHMIWRFVRFVLNCHDFAFLCPTRILYGMIYAYAMVRLQNCNDSCIQGVSQMKRR